MSEQAIRADIKAHIRRRYARAPEARLVEEMEVCAGRGRVDLALITQRFIGIEIKGPDDRLSRLGGQITQYSKCFDIVILVAHERLSIAAEKMIPDWWGLVVGTNLGETYSYHVARRPSLNPMVDLNALLSLLWREEIDQLFPVLLHRVSRARVTKKNLRLELMANADPQALKVASLSALRERTSWRASPLTPALTCVQATG